MKLSVVMPAYNEGKHIYNNLQGTMKKLSALKLNYELVLVDDGSTDNTFKEASRIKSNRIKVYRYSRNKGKGFASLYGSKYVSGDLVTFIDSDMDIDPEQIKTFLDYMKKYKADVVIGSKRHPKSELDYPLMRRILSRAYNAILGLVFGLNLTDTQTGMKLLKREVLEKVAPRMYIKRYAFDVELLANAHDLGFKIVEAPIVIKFKRGRFGRINVKDILLIGIDTAAIAYRLYIPQYYARILRDSGIMITAFMILTALYKLINPLAFPGMEGRTIVALIVLGILMVILNLPYDKFSERMG